MRLAGLESHSLFKPAAVAAFARALASFDNSTALCPYMPMRMIQGSQRPRRWTYNNPGPRLY